MRRKLNNLKVFRLIQHDVAPIEKLYCLYNSSNGLMFYAVLAFLMTVTASFSPMMEDFSSGALIFFIKKCVIFHMS